MERNRIGVAAAVLLIGVSLFATSGCSGFVGDLAEILDATADELDDLARALDDDDDDEDLDDLLDDVEDFFDDLFD